ncbi:alpha-amylase family glycosyl hydrolase [Novosphingobium percolationis]|uniref:alpha-amylase family glycosyl hydrolase n=1 Tax=Novosphingobium percolationis TaxID=2871811 RepID=UPI001CD1D7CE|nr:alpha-amylase family glycosyl hydrolase [Novosphingobium percolationis]
MRISVLLGAAALGLATPAMAEQPLLPVTEGVSQVRHPDWAARATIYEVNIRQYTPEGTFRAFEKHLPRLRKMGVDVLWIMPVNPIAKKERKGSLGSYYAVSDYKAVNPEYGDMADFRHLVAAAHAQGFKVILDWVANHTGWDHVWVEQHPDWYKRNAQGELEGYHYTDLSDHHEEVWADVIGLDYSKPAVREGMIDAMRYWLKEADIDGFRCDVAWTLPVAFWDQARVELEQVKPVFMLAEADTPEMQARAFDMTYDWKLYHLLIDVARGKADATDLAKLYADPPRRYPQGAYRMTFTSNHDENSWNGTDRELYGDGADAMAVLAATLPGMPLVYSGQEDGLNKRLKFFDKDPIVWGKFDRVPFYARLLALKHGHPALESGMERGNLRLIETGNPKVFAFRRVKGKDRVTVAVNLSGAPARVTLRGIGAQSLKGWGWSITPGR